MVQLHMGLLMGPNTAPRDDFCHNKVFKNSQTLQIALEAVMETIESLKNASFYYVLLQ